MLGQALLGKAREVRLGDEEERGRSKEGQHGETGEVECQPLWPVR